jgi:hypothetical protein
MAAEHAKSQKHQREGGGKGLTKTLFPCLRTTQSFTDHPLIVSNGFGKLGIKTIVSSGVQCRGMSKTNCKCDCNLSPCHVLPSIHDESTIVIQYLCA